MPKHFGARKEDPAPRRDFFTFGVKRGEEYEEHRFNTLFHKVHAGGLIVALQAVEQDDGAKAGVALYRAIAKVIDDRDGIPAGWKPTAIRKQPGDEREDAFRVPFGDRKGELLPMSQAAEYLESEAHSSLRRWYYLMEEDNDAVAAFEDLSAIFEWVIAESSGKASAASS